VSEALAPPDAPLPRDASDTPRAAVFVARRLCKTYRMGEVEVHALREVDLEIYEGEFVVLLGPSGSGKSTLLNILGGLDLPTSGEAYWRDHDLAHASEAMLTRYRRDHVGFVFQFYNLIPSLTVRENVALVTDIGERRARHRHRAAPDADRRGGRHGRPCRARRPFPVAAFGG